MALTPLEILKINLNESQYPVFSDIELENLLAVNDNNVLKASWRGCLLKAASDDEMKVGPVEMNSSNKDYWNNLAAIYKADYEAEQSKLNQSVSTGYRTSVKRADGC